MHPRGMVNSATPFCLGQCHSSTASLANNRLLFSTLVLRSLFSWRWKSFRSSISCKTSVFFRLEKNPFYKPYIPAWRCQMFPGHNCCRKLLLWFVLSWFLPRGTVDIASNLYLPRIETNHRGSQCMPFVLLAVDTFRGCSLSMW